MLSLSGLFRELSVSLSAAGISTALESSAAAAAQSVVVIVVVGRK